ncbi:MAG: rRNA pseudouridine synthase [Bacteroidetes bacterium]|nr:rRNA pseudouridine synthase [Bacteroidota bacterium]
MEKKNNYPPENLIRLNKFLANNTNFARRKIDEFIDQARVTVNHKVVTEQGMQVNPDSDDIRLDGEKIREKTKKLYIILNKPAGIITSTDDEKNRETVVDLINIKEKIFPVGRLDYDTTGLLLLTNDGDFANKLMHPKYKVTKTYVVKLSKPLDEKHKAKLMSGIRLEGRMTAPCKIVFTNKNDFETVAISLIEGRNRQVRKMFEHFGYFVRKLHRSAYGHVTLGNLAPGQWAKLSVEEVNRFFK